MLKLSKDLIEAILTLKEKKFLFGFDKIGKRISVERENDYFNIFSDDDFEKENEDDETTRNS